MKLLVDELPIGRATFRNGDADLANAYLILNNPSVGDLYGIACFHCHQSVEKYLKGFLIINGGEPPRIHDLKLLLDNCLIYDDRLSVLSEDCRDLTPYYIETRYEPSSPGDFDEDDARSAYTKAERTISAIKELLSVH